MANSAPNMELEPIVGASCAQCSSGILVEQDGRNCQKCGRAVHRRCSKAHRGACSGKPEVVRKKMDYDEVPTVAWTARWIAIVSASVMLISFGVGMLSAGSLSSGGKILAWTAMVLGFAVGVGGYVMERNRLDSDDNALTSGRQ